MSMSLGEYFARAGSRLTDNDAKVIGPELERLSREGKTRASEIVQEATVTTSPLHPYFEWNDQRAAHLYRESQAREIARSIVVKVEDEDGNQQDVRAFHAVRTVSEYGEVSEGMRSYVGVVEVSEQPILSHQVIEGAYVYLDGWRKRHEVYRAMFPSFEDRFGKVFEAIESMEEEVPLAPLKS